MKKCSTCGKVVELQSAEDLKAHYCGGKLPVAFVLSAPGSKENEDGMPVAGKTGANLEDCVRLLSKMRPDWFPGTCRYDYRITNASSEVEFKAMTGRSEASLVKVRGRIGDVVAELEGCRLVILCGKRAQSLLGGVKSGMSGVAFVRVCHPGVRGMTATYRGDRFRALMNASDRSSARRRAWVEDVCRSFQSLSDLGALRETSGEGGCIAGADAQSRATWNPANDCVTGMISSRLMLRCGGSVATWKICSAMSSAVIGLAPV